MTKLAIDIDGTLCDSFSYWKTIAHGEGVTESFDDTYNGIYKVRCSDGTILADKLFGKYRDIWVRDSSMFPEVPSFIDKINWNDHIKWWVVTSRGADVKTQTEHWLDKNNIKGFEGVLFLQDKTKAPCNCIVDDHGKHIQAYADNARMGFLLNRSYNKNYNVTRRVNNLMEVYDQILPYL